MSRRRTKLLVVDDEPAVLRAIRVALEANGYDVHLCTTGEQAVQRASAWAPDLVLLDLGLPGIDGLEVIRRLRAFLPTMPIIVLSAWSEDETKVQALDLGADDYVVKPFAVPELLARVRVGLRHAERQALGGQLEGARIVRGPLQIDTASRQVVVRGTSVQLTPTQFDLLLCFARHPGRVLTQRMIVAEVWGDPDAADAKNLRVFVSQLRSKIEDDPRRPSLIVTDTGVGYRFLPDGG
jgi:two-component system, OmpR family, KDP operon response regulator KdpE